LRGRRNSDSNSVLQARGNWRVRGGGEKYILGKGGVRPHQGGKGVSSKWKHPVDIAERRRRTQKINLTWSRARITISNEGGGTYREIITMQEKGVMPLEIWTMGRKLMKLL